MIRLYTLIISCDCTCDYMVYCIYSKILPVYEKLESLLLLYCIYGIYMHVYVYVYVYALNSTLSASSRVVTRAGAIEARPFMSQTKSHVTVNHVTALFLPGNLTNHRTEGSNLKICIVNCLHMIFFTVLNSFTHFISCLFQSNDW